jgi:hypothetical protein
MHVVKNSEPALFVALIPRSCTSFNVLWAGEKRGEPLELVRLTAPSNAQQPILPTISPSTELSAGNCIVAMQYCCIAMQQKRLSLGLRILS